MLKNRANIRTLLGSRSDENQEKIQKEKDEKKRLAAIEAEKRARIDNYDEIKMSKYYGKIFKLISKNERS